MDLRGFLSNLNPEAVFTSYNQKSIILYDGRLHLLTVSSSGDSQYEVLDDVIISPSASLPNLSVESIFVSSDSQFIVLQCVRGIYFIRMHKDLITGNFKSSQNEYFCETYAIRSSFYQNKSAPRVVQIREMKFSETKTSLLAILSSDNLLRFYDVSNQGNLSLDLDFGKFLFSGEKTQNTFGLGNQLVDFDVFPVDSSTFLLVAIDSEASFYSSVIHWTCFSDGEPAKIKKIETNFTMPLDPIGLSFLPHQFSEAFQALAVLFGGNIVQHIVLFVGELGTVEMFLQEQLGFPFSNGEQDSRLVMSSVSKNGVYELCTQFAVYLVDCGGWLKALGTDENSQPESIIQSVLTIQQAKSKETNKNVQVASVKISKDSESYDIVHIGKISGQRMTSLAVTRFTIQTAPLVETPKPKIIPEEKGILEQQSSDYHEKIKPLIEAMKPVSPLILDMEQEETKNIDLVIGFLEILYQRSESRRMATELALDRCLELTAGAGSLTETAESFDERIVEECRNVEELKAALFALKERVEQVRKKMNEVSSRIDENVPLTALEIRMFDRLQSHKKTLSTMTCKIPALALDVESEKKTARNIMLQTTSIPKFGDVYSNERSIENMEDSIQKMSDSLELLRT